MGQKLKCLKCNDIIESKFTHDFRLCTCGAIFIDGGDEYTRIGGFPEDMEWVEEDTDDNQRGESTELLSERTKDGYNIT